MCLREKKRHTKKTPSVIGSDTHKTKLDNEKGMGSEVLNVDSVVKPVFGLSNTDSEAELGFGNRKREKLGNELIVMICAIFIGLFCVFFSLNNSSEMVNAMTLKLSNVHLSMNFETIS